MKDTDRAEREFREKAWKNSDKRRKVEEKFNEKKWKMSLSQIKQYKKNINQNIDKGMCKYEAVYNAKEIFLYGNREKDINNQQINKQSILKLLTNHKIMFKIAEIFIESYKK